MTEPKLLPTSPFRGATLSLQDDERDAGFTDGSREGLGERFLVDISVGAGEGLAEGLPVFCKGD